MPDRDRWVRALGAACGARIRQGPVRFHVGYALAGMLKASRDHIDAAFLTGETSNKLAQRGSVRRAQGDTKGAIADFRRVVDLRSGAEQASKAAIGQGLSELGFALVFSGKISDGLSLMEKGLALFEGDPPDGFLVRAQRKMGRAYLRAFAPRRALAMMTLAHDNAVRINAQDQLSQIDRIAVAIQRQLRSTRPTSGSER